MLSPAFPFVSCCFCNKVTQIWLITAAHSFIQFGVRFLTQIILSCSSNVIASLFFPEAKEVYYYTFNFMVLEIVFFGLRSLCSVSKTWSLVESFMHPITLIQPLPLSRIPMIILGPPENPSSYFRFSWFSNLSSIFNFSWICYIKSLIWVSGGRHWTLSQGTV